MLFTEQDLSITNAMDILNEANYLSESESMINPQTIPVKEVSRIGYGVVRFDDVEKLSESYGCDYIDAMYMIAESSDMNPEYLAVAVPEEEIIAYPEIVNELANIVIQPLSEYDGEYQFVTECVNAYTESGDEDYLEYILNEKAGLPVAELLQRIAAATGQTRSQVAKEAKNLAKKGKKSLHNALLSLALGYNLITKDPSGTFTTYSNTHSAEEPPQPETPPSTPKPEPSSTPLEDNRGKPAQTPPTPPPKEDTPVANNQSRLSRATNWVKNNKVKTAVGVGLGAAAIGGGIYAYKQYKNKPKSVIAKRIAALRGIYKKFMISAQKNPQKANVFKRVAAKILSVIDKLLGYLQKKADGR